MPRLSVLSLLVAGVLFLLYPVCRPWADETTESGAYEALTSNWWVPAHVFAMIGFVLVALAVRTVAGAAPSVTMTLGAGLVLPYYGAEAWGLHSAATTPGTDLLAVVDATRYGPYAVTMFGVGLILLAVGAVWASVNIHRSDALPSWGGYVFAVGFVLFLPQFFAPGPVRIAHGVLMLIGLVVLAEVTRRSELVSENIPVAVHSRSQVGGEMLLDRTEQS